MLSKQFVLSLLGGPMKTARALGVVPGAVSQWPERLPDSAIGRIARLRPDVLRAWWDQAKSK